MNRFQSRCIAGATAAVLTFGLSAAGAQASQSTPAQSTERCSWTRSELPRTPDAVEGWYRGCRPTPGVPRTPTGVEGWDR